MPVAIDYIEKLTTAEERDIAHLLEGLLQAFGDRNFEFLKRILPANISVVFAKKKKKMRREEYLAELAAFGARVRTVLFRDALIKVAGDRGEAWLSRNVLFERESVYHVSFLHLVFHKKNGAWRLLALEVDNSRSRLMLKSL